MTYGGLLFAPLRFPTCYLFDAISDVLPASAVDFETSALESFWVRSEAKRGELCEVCTCVSSAANCTNRDLNAAAEHVHGERSVGAALPWAAVTWCRVVLRRSVARRRVLRRSVNQSEFN